MTLKTNACAIVKLSLITFNYGPILQNIIVINIIIALLQLQDRKPTSKYLQLG